MTIKMSLSKTIMRVSIIRETMMRESWTWENRVTTEYFFRSGPKRSTDHKKQDDLKSRLSRATSTKRYKFTRFPRKMINWNRKSLERPSNIDGERKKAFFTFYKNERKSQTQQLHRKNHFFLLHFLKLSFKKMWSIIRRY